MFKRAKFVLTCLLPLLAGCGVYQCIDSIIPRSPNPVNRSFNIELEFQGQVVNKEIYCEEYYDAQCSARGNSWRFREIGKLSGNDKSYFELSDDGLGKVIYPVPSCDSMLQTRSVTSLKQLTPVINGEKFHLSSSKDNVQTYVSWPFDESRKKFYEIEVSMKINGRRIKDCTFRCDNFQ